VVELVILIAGSTSGADKFRSHKVPAWSRQASQRTMTDWPRALRRLHSRVARAWAMLIQYYWRKRVKNMPTGFHRPPSTQTRWASA
jgi:hypothetical protein